jgi:hypothetical protein
VTDGERLVWATSYSIAFARGSDAVVASQVAATAVVQLRETAARRRLPVDGPRVDDLSLAEVDARLFLDEIVNVP